MLAGLKLSSAKCSAKEYLLWGRLSTVDLLIKVSYLDEFCKKVK
jgi:hypothetical protein